MRIRSAIALVIISYASPSLAYYEVECEGYDDNTSAYVQGTCTDGDFDGYDSETGEHVHGDCNFGDDLDGYNSDTGAHVSGECEGE